MPGNSLAAKEKNGRNEHADRPHLPIGRRLLYVHSFSTTALLVVICFYTLYFARDVFVPIFAAIGAYLLLFPVQRGLRRLRVPDAAAAALIVLALIAGVIFAFVLLAQPVGEWTARMPRILSEVQYKIKALKEPVEEVRQASREVEELTKVEGGVVPEVVVRDGSLLEQVFGNVALIGTQILLVVVLLYFLLATGDIFREKMVRVMPTWQDKRRAVQITHDIQKEVSLYLITITFINVGLGACIGGAMWLAGMPSPVVWGVMATILNFVPYFGAIVGGIIVGMVALITFPTVEYAVSIPLIYLALTSLEGQFVTPSILGRRLTLNPLVIFVTVVLWGWLWGVPGALLAVPILVTFKVICDNVDSLRPIGEFLSGRTE